MIVVTGGAGFIGSNVVAAIEEAGLGHAVVVDRLDHPAKRRNLEKRSDVEVVPPEGLDALLADRRGRVEHVVHMGAITSTSETDEALLSRVNVELPKRLWRWCAKEEVPLLYASSAATYGDGAHGFDDDPAPEALARLRPLSPYARSKHALDLWVADQVERGAPAPPSWAGLKLFNVYGPNEYHKGAMRSWVAKAYPGVAAGEPVELFRSHRSDVPDGAQARDFVYVEDCVAVVLWLLSRPEATGLFNVGTGRATTWLELAGALFAAADREPEVRWRDTPAELRSGYQYHTRAELGRLRAAGYDGTFRAVGEGVARYVKSHLATDDPHV